MAFGVRTGSASVIGAQRTISFDLDAAFNGGQEIKTGVNYITNAVVSMNNAADKAAKVEISGSSVTVTAGSASGRGVLTVFGYGGG
jgi:hypothetical protein